MQPEKSHSQPGDFPASGYYLHLLLLVPKVSWNSCFFFKPCLTDVKPKPLDPVCHCTSHFPKLYKQVHNIAITYLPCNFQINIECRKLVNPWILVSKETQKEQTNQAHNTLKPCDKQRCIKLKNNNFFIVFGCVLKGKYSGPHIPWPSQIMYSLISRMYLEKPFKTTK